MVILISGTTHAGKTVLSQKLMERYKIPYYSIDHLKMGLIRSGQTNLTPCNEDELTPYLWSIVKEIIKTAIENKQNLIIEGCYIPFDWKKDFDEKYLSEIEFYCLVMTKNYIENNLSDIIEFENIVERRFIGDKISEEQLIKDNDNNLRLCRQFRLNYILIEKTYDINRIMNSIKIKEVKL